MINRQYVSFTIFIEKTMEKYARVSDFNGKGMNEGYCFQEGNYYCKTEKQAKAYIESLGLNWEEELLTVNTKDEWFYWTDWYDTETDEYYDIDGNIISGS